MGLGWRPYGLSLLYEVHVHLQSSGGPTQTAGVHTLIWCSSYISNTNIPFLSCHSRTPSWDFIPKEILMSAPSWVIPWTIHLLQVRFAPGRAPRMATLERVKRALTQLSETKIQARCCFPPAFAD